MKEKFIGTSTQNGHITCRMLSDKDEEICACEISVSGEGIWNITSWHTKESFRNKGFGRRTMKLVLSMCRSRYGKPSVIRYTWNGVNAYVLEWMERHFNAVCTCPVAVQKNQAGDDWESHIYELDKDKVFGYFEL